MNRTQFETLRSTPKSIEGDITLKSRRGQKLPVVEAKLIEVVGCEPCRVHMNIRHNQEIDLVVINVFANEVGAFCRLCVNGNVHGEHGPTHKHSVPHPEAAGRQRFDKFVEAQPELSVLDIQEVWAWFCKRANICHNGLLVVG